MNGPGEPDGGDETEEGDLLDRAVRARDEGRFEEAIELGEAYLEENPGDAHAEALLEDARDLAEEIGQDPPDLAEETARARPSAPPSAEATHQLTLEGELAEESTRAPREEAAVSRAPAVGIVLLVAYYGLGAVSLLLSGLAGLFSGHGPAISLGFLALTGAGIHVWISLGLWRLQKAAWVAALAVGILSIAGSVVLLSITEPPVMVLVAVNGLVLAYLFSVGDVYDGSTAEPDRSRETPGEAS